MQIEESKTNKNQKKLVEKCQMCTDFRCCPDHCCNWDDCRCNDCEFCGGHGIEVPFESNKKVERDDEDDSIFNYL